MKPPADFVRKKLDNAFEIKCTLRLSMDINLVAVILHQTRILVLLRELANPVFTDIAFGASDSNLRVNVSVAKVVWLCFCFALLTVANLKLYLTLIPPFNQNKYDKDIVLEPHCN